MGNGNCSICAAPVEVIGAINDALRKKEKLRDIEARAGFSRSALSRHSRNCIPKLILAEHKARAAKPRSGRHVVQWPPAGTLTTLDGPGERSKQITIASTELRPDDILLVVEYEPAVQAREPEAFNNSGTHSDVSSGKPQTSPLPQ
jgi:hypothetical protein